MAMLSISPKAWAMREVHNFCRCCRRPRFTRQEYDECIGKFEKDLIGLKLFYMFGDTSFVESFKVNSLDNVEIKTGVEWRPYGKTLKGKLIIKYVDLEYPQVTLYVNDKLIARGEAVVINEKFGIRLTDIIILIKTK